MEPEKDHDDQRAPEERGGEHPNVQAASELSGQAAESVGRRYDATKESVHEAHAQDQEERDGEERDGD